jgi:hypothetical protein
LSSRRIVFMGGDFLLTRRARRARRSKWFSVEFLRALRELRV